LRLSLEENTDRTKDARLCPKARNQGADGPLPGGFCKSVIVSSTSATLPGWFDPGAMPDNTWENRVEADELD
jgi:hypothetical protein